MRDANALLITRPAETSVIDFAWEPRGDRFVIISSNDPNLGNPGPGITIKSDVSFYQLEKGKNFKLLREFQNPSKCGPDRVLLIMKAP